MTCERTVAGSTGSPTQGSPWAGQLSGTGPTLAVVASMVPPAGAVGVGARSIVGPDRDVVGALADEVEAEVQRVRRAAGHGPEVDHALRPGDHDVRVAVDRIGDDGAGHRHGQGDGAGQDGCDPVGHARALQVWGPIWAGPPHKHDRCQARSAGMTRSSRTVRGGAPRPYRCRDAPVARNGPARTSGRARIHEAGLDEPGLLVALVRASASAGAGSSSS